MLRLAPASLAEAQPRTGVEALPAVTRNQPDSSIINALQSKLPSGLDVWHTASQAPLVRTFKFETSQPGDINASFSGWTAFTAGEKAIARAVLAEYEAIINIDFVETTGSDADLSLGLVQMSDGGLGGYRMAYSYNGSGITSKSFDSFAVVNRNLDLDTIDGRSVLVHEIGHALMLKHPGPYGGSSAPYLPARFDNNKYSVMSYNSNPDTGSDSGRLMLYDIAALQARFGANLAYRTGDDVYTGPNGPIDAIWDAGGTDMINGGGYGGALKIDLRDGRFSSLGDKDNFAIAYGVIIENATGGGAGDTITGNDWRNVLSGNGGGDRLYGLKRGDTIDGGEGNDRLYGGDGNDELTGGGGGDRFVFDARLDSTKNVDTITDFGAGDVIALDRDVFTAFTRAGGLKAGAFHAGPTAHDGDDRIVYDDATGNLFYDRNGSDAGGAKLFARLATGLDLSAGDFVVI